MSNIQGKSALGMDGNATALLGYFIWIIALVLLFIEKENKFVRFHAFQSVFWGLGTLLGAFLGYILWILLFAVGTIVGAMIDVAIGIPIVTILVWLISIVVFILAIAVLFGGFIWTIVAAIKSFNGEYYKLPIVGKFAEKNYS